MMLMKEKRRSSLDRTVVLLVVLLLCLFTLIPNAGGREGRPNLRRAKGQSRPEGKRDSRSLKGANVEDAAAEADFVRRGVRVGRRAVQPRVGRRAVQSRVEHFSRERKGGEMKEVRAMTRKKGGKLGRESRRARRKGPWRRIGRRARRASASAWLAATSFVRTERERTSRAGRSSSSSRRTSAWRRYKNEVLTHSDNNGAARENGGDCENALKRHCARAGVHHDRPRLPPGSKRRRRRCVAK